MNTRNAKSGGVIVGIFGYLGCLLLAGYFALMGFLYYVGLEPSPGMGSFAVITCGVCLWGACRSARWGFRTKDPYKKTKLAIAIATIVFLAVLMRITFLVHQDIAYGRQVDAGMELLQSLDHRRPSATSEEVWECAVGWTGIAYPNVFFHRDFTPYEELFAFNKDLSDRLDGEVSLETIDWFWQRLAEAGPKGARYVSRYEPQYRSQLKEAEKSAIEKVTQPPPAPPPQRHQPCIPHLTAPDSPPPAQAHNHHDTAQAHYTKSAHWR